MSRHRQRAAILVVVAALSILGTSVVAASVANAAPKTADVGTAAVTVSLQANGSPIVVGSAATVTVTVAGQDAGGGTPTGTVQVDVDGSASGAPVSLVKGAAVWQDGTLSVGAHQITASYSGDPTFATGTGSGQTVVVLPIGTSRYVPLTPARILDTRPGATQTGYQGGKPGAGATVPVQVDGVGGVPATGVSGVVLNVTGTDSTAAGFVTVSPSGSPRPLASTLNLLGANQTVANLAVTPVGSDGQVDLFTQSGADLVVDVQGYFTSSITSAAGRLVSLTPARILDTRPGPTQTGYQGGKPAAGATIPVQVTGAGGVPATGVFAVALNMTATDSTNPGFLTAWPAGQPRPLASNLNVDTGNQTLANAVWVPVGANGVVNVFVSAGADVVIDVDGYYTDATAPDSSAGLFVPTEPTRMLDTRGGSQIGYQGGKPAAGATVPLTLAGRTPVGATGAAAVVGNTTVTDTAGSGFVTVWPAGVPRPLASNVNLTGVNDTAATLTTSPLGGGALDLFTQSSADLIFDVDGYFLADLNPDGQVTSHESATPAANTTVFQAGQVTSITEGDSGTTVVFDKGVTVPAVGAGVVVDAGGSFTDGAGGDVSSVTQNADGTTTVVLTPATLDSLFDNLSIGYDGPADLELVTVDGSVVHPHASSGSSGNGFNFADAFSCDANGVAVEAASLTFENTVVHAEFDSSLTSPSASFTMSTEPVVEFSGEVSGTVNCTLTSAFQNKFQLRWVFPGPAGVPVVVTVKPTLTFNASAEGDFDVVEHFYRTIGFTASDDGIDLVNDGAQANEEADIGAQLQASLAFGAAISVKILGIAGVNVNVGPKFVATADDNNGQNCTTLTAELDGSVNAQVNLLFKKLTSKTISGVMGPWTLFTTCPVEITTTDLPDGLTGEPYDTDLDADGGTGPLTWSVTSGSLPDGLTMSDDGEISGSPTTSGESDFEVTATDTLGVNATADLSIDVLSTAQCVYTDIATCESVDPNIEIDLFSNGDTSACTFTANFDWGDGTTGSFDFAGGPDGTEFSFTHGYTAPGDYTINLNGVVDSGDNCTFGDSQLEFELDAVPSGATAKPAIRAGGQQPQRILLKPKHAAKAGQKPGLVLG